MSLPTLQTQRHGLLICATRYLLASFSDELKKGSSYDVTLRIVRPTLPIERLWAYRQGNAMQQKRRADAEGIAEGTQTDNYYPSLNSKLYRLPKYSEFIPIFNNPKVQLNKKSAIRYWTSSIYWS